MGPTQCSGRKRHPNITEPADEDIEAEESVALASNLDDFNVGLAGEVLLPMLTDSGLSDDLQHRRAEIGQVPTGASTTSTICNIVPLNGKQRLVVEKVLTDLLICAGNPYGSALRNQAVLYVGGEGVVGKSQIIKAIVAAMDLM